MRLRTSPHRQSPAAYLHTVGDRRVALLPIDPFYTTALADLTARYRDARPDASEGEAHFSAIAALLWYCWDDAEVEWVTPGDPESVLTLTGEAFATLAAQLRTEMISPTTMRLGIVPYSPAADGSPSLMLAGVYHSRGQVRVEDVPTGEASPPTPTT